MNKIIKPMIRIHNAETGEILDREMNDDEFAQYKKEQKTLPTEEIQAEQVSKDPIIAAEQAAEKAAQKAALLTRLGLTEDELKTILG